MGLENNEWRTSSSAAYPPLFCDFLARVILSALDESRQVGQGLDSTFVRPAEALAEALLHSGQVPLPDDVAAVFALLPCTKAHAAAGNRSQGSAFFAGANWESAGLVLRKNTGDFPQTCALVCRFIACLDESHCFGAFVILEDVLSAPHKDGKHAHSPNLVVAISHFQGGQIWHEDASGDVQRVVHGNLLRGRLLSLQDGPVQVFAKDKFYQPEPCARGISSREAACLGTRVCLALAVLGVQISRASVGDALPNPVLFTQGAGCLAVGPDETPF